MGILRYDAAIASGHGPLMSPAGILPHGEIFVGADNIVFGIIEIYGVSAFLGVAAVMALRNAPQQRAERYSQAP